MPLYLDLVMVAMAVMAGLFDLFRIYRLKGIVEEGVIGQVFPYFFVILGLYIINSLHNLLVPVYFVVVAIIFFIAAIMIDYFWRGKRIKVYRHDQNKLQDIVHSVLNDNRIKYTTHVRVHQSDANHVRIFYELDQGEASILLRSAGRLTYPRDYELKLNKWWHIPYADQVIDDLVYTLRSNRNILPIHRYRQFALLIYSMCAMLAYIGVLVWLL